MLWESVLTLRPHAACSWSFGTEQRPVRQARKERRLVEPARHDPEEARIHGDAEQGRDHASSFDARLRCGFVAEKRIEHGGSSYGGLRERLKYQIAAKAAATTTIHASLPQNRSISGTIAR